MNVPTVTVNGRTGGMRAVFIHWSGQSNEAGSRVTPWMKEAGANQIAAVIRGALADAYHAGRAEGFNEGQRFPNLAPHELSARLSTCQHCNRLIVKIAGGAWIDPEATGDDEVWRETCDQHDTFTAEHEPADAS